LLAGVQHLMAICFVPLGQRTLTAFVLISLGSGERRVKDRRNVETAIGRISRGGAPG
jgi:hypothetical protein